MKNYAHTYADDTAPLYVKNLVFLDRAELV